MDSLFTLFVFLLVVFLAILLLFSSKRIARATTYIQESYSKVGEALQRFISNAIFVKTNNLDDRMHTEYEDAVDAVYLFGRKVARLTAALGPLANLLVQICIILIVVFGIYRVQSGALDYAGLSMFIMLMYILIAPIGTIFNGVSTFAAAYAAFKRFDLFIDTPSIDKALPSKKDKTSKVSSFPILKFTNVDMRYKDDGPLIIKNFSYEFPSKGLVAITGQSGVGKTTLALLATGVISPSSGTISINDEDIRNIGFKVVREKIITFVMQNAPMWGRTVRESLLLDRQSSNCDLDQWINKVLLSLSLIHI